MPLWILTQPAKTRAKYERWATANPDKVVANRARQNAYTREWRRNNRALVNAQERRARDKNRAHYNLRTQAWRYGLTKEQLQDMITQQKGRCAICGEQKPLHVDHAHDTNKVRALLCRPCNLGLGCFRDDPSRLRLARRYLIQHQGA